MSILQAEPSTKLIKDVNCSLKFVKELSDEFMKISNKTYKYNRQRSGGKYAYLYNDDQGEVVDMFQKKTKHIFAQDSPDITSKNLKNISVFTEMLEIMTLIKLGKWSAKNLSH